jgi:mannose-6-phosphate isomerase-like protein (cupin superfamily)
VKGLRFGAARSTDKQAGTESMVEEILSEGTVLALILRASFEKPGIHFFTPDDYSQQLGYMCHPRGKIIEPHVHNEVPRAINLTQEVLFIRRGKVRVDFYTDKQVYTESRVLDAGDVILLASGGHGFEALEELEMIEVKQGPYVGGLDKTRFSPPNCTKVILGT